MIKFIITCVIVLLASTAHSNPVRATGVGATEDAARRHAFQRAIESKVGTLLLTEVVVQDQRLVKDDIFDFSSGYVDRFTVISVEQRSGQYIVVADVWVSDSKIKSRIISKNTTSTVNGSAISEKVASYTNTKQQGDVLVAKAVEFYPSRSFDVALRNSDFKLDSNRQVYYTAQVSVTWTKSFIQSLQEILAKIEDGDKSSASTTVMIADAPNDDNFFRPNARKSYYFNDGKAHRILTNIFERRSPVLVVSFNQGIKNIHSACVPLSTNRYFSQARIDDIRINTYQKDLISIAVPLYNVDLKSVTEVMFSVIGKDQC